MFGQSCSNSTHDTAAAACHALATRSACGGPYFTLDIKPRFYESAANLLPRAVALPAAFRKRLRPAAAGPGPGGHSRANYSRAAGAQGTTCVRLCGSRAASAQAPTSVRVGRRIGPRGHGSERRGRVRAAWDLVDEGGLAGCGGGGEVLGEANEGGRELEEALRLALLRRDLRPQPSHASSSSARHDGGRHLHGAGLGVELAPLARPLPVEAAVAELVLQAPAPLSLPRRTDPVSHAVPPATHANAEAGASRTGTTQLSAAQGEDLRDDGSDAASGLGDGDELLGDVLLEEGEDEAEPVALVAEQRRLRHAPLHAPPSIQPSSTIVDSNGVCKP